MDEVRPEDVWNAEARYAKEAIEKAKKKPADTRMVRATRNPTILAKRERGETITLYDFYGEMLKDDMGKKGEQMPAEGTNAFYLLMMAEKREYDAREPYLLKLYMAQEKNDPITIMKALEQIVAFNEKRYGISREQVMNFFKLPEKERNEQITNRTLRKHTLDAEEAIHVKAKKTLRKKPATRKKDLSQMLSKTGTWNEQNRNVKEVREQAKKEMARKETKVAKKKYKGGK